MKQGLAALLQGIFWSIVTLVAFWGARRLHARWPRPWLAPLVVTPLVVGLVIVMAGVSYQQYFAGTGWLVWMLGPATVAFAVPVYQQRALVREHWPVLLAATIAGSVTSVLSSWWLAGLVGLDGALRNSLLPHSITTPFAMPVAGQVGGVPSLAAIFVVVTGLVGAVIGELLLAWAGARSPLTRGAVYGVGAHAIGTARALQEGPREGAIAGLVMVLTGLLNLLAAPLVVRLFALLSRP